MVGAEGGVIITIGPIDTGGWRSATLLIRVTNSVPDPSGNFRVNVKSAFGGDGAFAGAPPAYSLSQYQARGCDIQPAQDAQSFPLAVNKEPDNATGNGAENSQTGAAEY